LVPAGRQRLNQLAKGFALDIPRTCAWVERGA
jgi:hypothetical protein